jgi:hypothetical protein
MDINLMLDAKWPHHVDFDNLDFYMVKYWNFYNFSFALKYIFNINGKAHNNIFWVLQPMNKRTIVFLL